MKIKILKSSGWYKGLDGTEFEVDRYHLTSPVDLRFSAFNHGWIYSCDCVIIELPESFCVKRCDDNKKWYKYLEWLIKQKNYSISMFVREFVGVLDGVIGEKLHYDDLYPFGTEIHIDDMIKHIDYMERHIKGGEQFHKESQLTVKMETQRLSREGLKEIYSVACDEWQGKLKSFGYRNPLENYIDLTKEEVNEMFFASNDKQKSILSKYLKKEDDGSVDVSGCNISTNKIIDIRGSGEYENKSFWLSEIYNWEMKKDSIGKLCLIPTKKK